MPDRTNLRVFSVALLLGLWLSGGLFWEMVAGPENTEAIIIKCHVCGERLEPTISDLPFRLGPTSIVVIKKLPVLECTNCTEFSIEDPIMEKVEHLLEQTDGATELEVIAYAA